MMEQLTLMAPPPKAPPNGDQQHVLDALTLGPGTVHELRHRLGQVGIVRAENCIAKRLSELGPDTPKSKGMYLVERTGERRPGGVVSQAARVEVGVSDLHRVPVERNPQTGLLPFCPMCGSYLKCSSYCSAQGRYHLPRVGQLEMDLGGAA